MVIHQPQKQRRLKLHMIRGNHITKLRRKPDSRKCQYWAWQQDCAYFSDIVSHFLLAIFQVLSLSLIRATLLHSIHQIKYAL